MAANSGRRLLRSLRTPTLNGVVAPSKVVVTDSTGSVTGLNLINPTFVNAVSTSSYTASATTLTAVGGQNINFSTPGTSTVTLPAATGSGKRVRIFTTVISTGSYIVQVANAQDFMIGFVQTIDGATVTGYVAANSGTVATNSDTFTLNHTTTGGSAVGCNATFEDIAPNTWLVSAETVSSGTAATPFTAAV